MAWFKSSKHKQPLEAQTSIDGLRAMHWRDFEPLIAEAFRKRGYAVEKTGHGGLNGDIDLVLRKGGRTELVQCKQWKTRQVHSATVHEMWSLVAHHKADAVKIVSVGTFAADAQEFAKGKPIELIDGEQLLKLVRDVKVPVPAATAEPAPTPQAATTPVCPRCGSSMYQRFNLQTNKMYWGCTRYPGCKGAVQI
jgi:restriction system protein